MRHQALFDGHPHHTAGCRGVQAASRYGSLPVRLAVTARWAVVASRLTVGRSRARRLLTTTIWRGRRRRPSLRALRHFRRPHLACGAATSHPSCSVVCPPAGRRAHRVATSCANGKRSHGRRLGRRSCRFSRRWSLASGHVGRPLRVVLPTGRSGRRRRWHRADDRCQDRSHFRPPPLPPCSSSPSPSIPSVRPCVTSRASLSTGTRG
jgi:hypothetical protein